MSNDFIFISGNVNKVKQLRWLLGREVKHHKLDLDEIQSLDLHEVVEHKVRQAYGIVKQPVLVEDVSLVFSAIAPLPGPFIKWFEEPGIETLCRILDGFDDRQAEARVCYGLFDGTKLHFFEGVMSGRIAQKPRGTGGFGFDPIFMNDDFTQTRAEMDEKGYVVTSYRTQAIEKLKAHFGLG